MLENYNYMLVQFYDGESHLCELYKNLQQVATSLGVNRSTIYKNFKKELNYYLIVKDKTEYYIKKIL